MTKAKTKKPKLMMNGHTDEIYTPKCAINILLPFIRKDWIIWECALGSGKIKEYLENEGFKVYGDKDMDFLNIKQPYKPTDLILTNPPYTIKDKFLKHAFEIGKPFAFLLPITALGGQKRIELFKKYGIQLIIPNKRINYITPNEGKSSWFHSVWFTWGLNLPKDLMFVELKESDVI